MSKLHELAELGQSIWLDYIRRSFIATGEFEQLVSLGVRGMTSNPSIFEKAIVGSNDYDEDLRRLAEAGETVDNIYVALAREDIQQAADLLRPVYDQTSGADGYISLEVSPTLANDTEATISEAQRLWTLVDRPNLMIKIPATLEGIPAITETIAAGINVNVTLIFSLARYGEVMAAYIKGLLLRQKAGQTFDQIASVASFFISRVDSKVDKLLDEIIREEGPHAELARSLRGQAAVANARLAYSQFRAVFEGEQFAELQAGGARLQRPLWASTSTKDPAYSDIKYVEELIAPHTVNTLPQETLEAFIDHGEVRLSLEEGVNQARFVLQSLADLGISMDQVTQELEEEGVAAFAKSFESLMNSIAEKRERIAPTEVRPSTSPAFPSQPMGMQIHLHPERYDYQQTVDAALDEIEAQQVIQRLWAHDHTLWKPEPDEIANRLGWLDAVQEMQAHVPEIEAFVNRVKQEGFTQALLLGMGGSSLAPELFSQTFGGDGLDVRVLDSTAPGSVLDHAERMDPNRSLFIVSTKSGTTEETLSFFKYFYQWVAGALGADQAGSRFVAITDPGSKLEELAQRLGFRHVFINDPNIGGRYSALSYFGLVPAALSGVDLPRLLENASQMSRMCSADVPARKNPAALLGALLGELAKAGRDKVTFVLPAAIASFGDWVEQLVAESTGKEGKGILPVVGEPLGLPAIYGDDRVFVHLDLQGEASELAALQTLQDSGFPALHIPLKDRYDLGGQFLLWEMATAIAGHRLGIQPFDQPDVESAKKAARAMMASYRESGALPEEAPLTSKDGIAVYGPPAITGADVEWALEASEPGEALVAFLTQAQAWDYIAVQAFVQPDEATGAALNELRLRLRNRYQLATTIGYGPRFLHSTGQLHKGDAGNGLFIQLTADSPQDAPIPTDAASADSAYNFGVLLLAQALGDRQALLEAGRRVIRFHFAGDVAKGIRKLTEALG